MGSDFENFINSEIPRRQVLVKGEGAPTEVATQGTQYINTLTDDRWEKKGQGINANWILLALGSAGAVGQGEQTLVEIMDCAAELIVGGLVRISTEVDGYVDWVKDNATPKPVMGICIEKIDGTSAKIRFFGKTSTTASGLSRGYLVFLQENGTMGPSVPAIGYRQILGVARSANVVHFNPELVLTKRAS